jgi:hypothetical protein
MLEVISRSADNVPDYLLDLIGKVKMMGKSKYLVRQITQMALFNMI